MVRIPGFHPGDPGSSPGGGIFFRLGYFHGFCCFIFDLVAKQKVFYGSSMDGDHELPWCSGYHISLTH